MATSATAARSDDDRLSVRGGGRRDCGAGCFRVFPAYIEYFSVQKALKGALDDRPRISPRRTSASWSNADERRLHRVGERQRHRGLAQRQRHDGVGELADASCTWSATPACCWISKPPLRAERGSPPRWPDTLRNALGYTFRRPDLLRQALTHRSFGSPHNERLEFIGDAVLNCVVGATLYERFPALPEGDLSRVRAGLVNRDTLARVAAALDLGARDPPGRRRGEKRRQRAAVDSRGRARGDVRRGVRRRRIRGRTRRRSSAATPDVLRDADPAIAGQGSQDAIAGVAAGTHACRCRNTR